MTGYKATRPGGTSFWDGRTRWEVGGTVRVPGHAKRLCAAGVLHWADAPGEALSGGHWPCRLFAVSGTVVARHGHKLGSHSLRVLEELPAWQALGPNGQEVAALIDRAARLTIDEARGLAAAWDAAWDAAWTAARTAALNAASDAEQALVVRDLISAHDFELLYRPWQEVMG